MNHYLRIIFSALLVGVLSTPAWAASKAVSIDFQEIQLADALRITAKFSQTDVVLNPAISGRVSLHLQKTSMFKAFDAILESHQLVKIKQHGVWYVTTQQALIDAKKEHARWQEALQETADVQTRVWQLHYAKAADIAKLLDQSSSSIVSSRGHIQADTRTNQLCIEDTPKFLNLANAFIQKLDIPVQQVLIHARLASIDYDYQHELGVNFSVHDGSAETGSATWSGSGPRFNVAIAKLPNGNSLDVALSALESEGHGELISSPTLFTANGQVAKIESGEEIPYQESASSGATSIAFKKAVLSLEVIPHVMPQGRVLLQLKVNQDKPNNRVVLGVPAITTRQLTTNVLIKNGQTVVLGGIYELEKEHDDRQIPVMGNLPLIGWLFKQQNARLKKRELFIFVTSEIIS
jgi:type IV pilus assembly protein PilQ